MRGWIVRMENEGKSRNYEDGRMKSDGGRVGGWSKRIRRWSLKVEV